VAERKRRADDAVDSDLDKDADLDNDADLDEAVAEADDAEPARKTPARKTKTTAKAKVKADADVEKTDAEKTDAKKKASKAGAGDKSKSEKAKRPEKREGRRGPISRIGRFIREVVAELRKVIWPSRKDLITYAAVVIVFVAVMLTIVGFLDFGFAKATLAVFGSGSK
jgi:preprotein translocase subunit SecE